MMPHEKPVPHGARKVYPTSKLVIRVLDAGKDPMKDNPREVVTTYPRMKPHGEPR